ncbi:MAG TPA: carboxypeptidase-like regulatory domain-containing protein [Terriglobales bacterium]|nr:carboxypeptidase-like regulatory domain-containing protein [Terriglobales bacterium]
MKAAFRFSSIRVLLVLFALAVLLGLPNMASAQEVASLTGVVSDTTGAVVADATVKLVDTKTNAVYTTKTNGVGAYVFPKILPGPGYSVTFSKDGFATLTVTNIYLAVASVHTQNAELKLSSLSETVEVNGQGANVSLNTTDTTVGNNFDMQLVHELPIQLRDNPTGLLIYEPGVVAAAGPDDPSGNRSGAVTGSRADQGSYTLDGLDVNDYAIGQSFIVVGQAPVDSIQEFRGETANPLSSEGRGSGAQVSLVTKSGTNQWHGSASEYHRNTVTEANGWFSNHATPIVPRPVLLRNQFGASLGGPVLKNKLFFFFDYEARRDASQAPVEWTVPLDSYRNGLVSYVNNGPGCSPASRQNTQPACITSLDSAQVQAINPGNLPPLNTALLNYINGRYPHANDFTSAQAGDGVNTGGFRTNLPAHDSPNIYVSRIDYNLNSKMKLFGRFTIQREIQGDNFNFPAPSEFPGDPLTRVAQNHNYAYVVGHTWTISNTMVNQFEYGLTRQKFATPSLFNKLGNTDYVNGGGTSDFGIISAPYESQSAQDRHVSVPVFRDDFTYVRGAHTFQVGGVFKPISLFSSLGNSLFQPSLGIGGNLGALDSSARPQDILQNTQQNPNLDPANIVLGLWDAALPFAMGRYSGVTTNYNYNNQLQGLPAGTPSVRHYKAYETEVYLQDAWKARKDLTVTYGLRYTYYSVPYETNGLEAISNLGFSQYIAPRIQSGLQGTGACGATLTACPATGVAPGDPLITYSLGGKKNHAPGYYHPDWRDFAPRLGFAYNPSFADGLLGRVLGDRKTVIRAGAGIVYDHPALNSVQFLQNQVAAVFTTSAAVAYPTQSFSTAAQGLSAGPFFNTIGEVPAGLPGPGPITIPSSPFTQFVGQGVVQNQLNFAFDPNFKTPYSETVTFGIQRELPHNFQLDATFFGRFGRRLMAQSDAGELVDFRDPTSGSSGQLMGQAFAALSSQMRTLPGVCSQPVTVTPQPFFEDLIGGGGTSLIANSILCPFALRGDMGSTVFILERFGLLPFGVGFNPQYPYDIYAANKSASNYDGLLVTLHKKYSQGVQFDLNYTYSHSIDNLSAIANNVFGQSANFSGGILCDPVNLRVCRGNSDFDATHLISGDGLYDLPFGRGKFFGGQASGWMNQIIGGWQIAGETQWRTGFAFTTLANAFPLSFNNNVPAIFNGDTSAVKVKVHQTSTGQIQLFANPTAALAAFSEPLGFQAGSRNNLRGPHFALTNLSLNKHFSIREKYVVEFRAEAYNAFNHPSFALPGGGFGGTADISNPPTFGTIATTASAARAMQFGLRVDF